MVIPAQGADPTFDRPGASQGVAIAILAVLPLFLTSALAVQVGESLDFDVGVLGAIVAAFYLCSSVLSPAMGRVVEALGPQLSAAWATTISATALVGAASAQSALQLAVASAVAGAANAMLMPAANMMLSQSTPVHRLGLAFGIKQSCVPAAALVGGLAVPTVALVFGWRWAYGAAAIVCAAYAARLWVKGRDTAKSDRATRGSLRDSEAPISALLFLTVAGFLAAFAATSLSAFFVDSAVHEGYSPAAAGWLYALLALGTICSRIGLGWSLDRSPSRSRFALIALLLASGSVGYWLIPSDNTVLFSVGAVLAFVAGWGWVGAFHYTVVTWYRAAPAAATGFVSTGLNLGSGLGPLTFGLIAQHLGYRTAWYAAGMVSLLAAITVVAARRHLRARRRPRTQTDDPDG